MIGQANQKGFTDMSFYFSLNLLYKLVNLNETFEIESGESMDRNSILVSILLPQNCSTLLR